MKHVIKILLKMIKAKNLSIKAKNQPMKEYIGFDKVHNFVAQKLA